MARTSLVTASAAALLAVSAATAGVSSASAAPGHRTEGDRPAFRAGARPSPHAADPSFGPSQRGKAIAEATLQRTSTARALRLGNGQALVVKDVQRDTDGTEHVRYERTYQGLPVVGGDLVVHTSPTGATTSRFAHSRAVSADLTATVPAAEAPGTGARRVVYATRTGDRLAWQTTVTGRDDDGTPIHRLVYTDARTGKRLGTRDLVFNDSNAVGTGKSLYSGRVAIRTIKHTSKQWQLIDGVRGRHAVYDKKGSFSSSRGTLFTDSNDYWGSGTTSSRQSAAVDAAYGAMKTWDFYRSMGRTGIRNDGKAAYSRVHFGTGYGNAFWDDTCFCMSYGDGDDFFKPLLELDIAGHEMTHGVTANTAGLEYTGDAGGLNESTSDVMGTAVEFYAKNASDPGDYLLGEKALRHGAFLRRMDNPAADASLYSGGLKSYNCYPGLGAFDDDPTQTDDPHFTSGVGNHAFYLMAEGTANKTIAGHTYSGHACSGPALTGITRDKAVKIWYRALTTYFVSDETYPEAADDMVRAAKDLYGTGTAECTGVVDAWHGVDVPTTQTCDAVEQGNGTNVVGDGSFEGAGWTQTPGPANTGTVITTRPNTSYPAPRTGTHYADFYVDGDAVSQSVTVPATGKPVLRMWLVTNTANQYDPTGGSDPLVVTFNGTSLGQATSNDYSGTKFVSHTFDLSSVKGQTGTLRIEIQQSSHQTEYLVDDVSLVAAAAPGA